jgi:uncharacterized membrane protein
VSPVLGIIASQNYVRIPPSSFESIATVSLTSSAASVDFTSIPSTYQHLQLRIFAHTDRASDNNGYGSFRVNSDSGSNYSWHQLYGDGASVGAGGAANQTLIPLNAFGGNSNSAFGISVIDFLDYADTNKYKTTRCLNGLDYNGGGEINLISGNWRSTSAITSINIVRGFAVNNWVAGSIFALYGIKG